MGKATVMTADKIKELKDVFSMGASMKEAYTYCWIPERTFFDYCSKNPDFKDLIPALQNQPKLKAKMNILVKLNEWDDYNSRWLLEKTDKDFNPKQVVDNNLTWSVSIWWLLDSLWDNGVDLTKDKE